MVAPTDICYRVNDPPHRAVLIWDGGCRFCALWIERWREATGTAVEYVRAGDLGPRFPQLQRDEFERHVVLVTPDGRVRRGAEAACFALELGGVRWPARIGRWLPGSRRLASAAYDWIAAHRGLGLRLTRWFWGTDVRRPRYDTAVPLFLRLLGLTYLIAFVSLGAQIHGLVGSQGILPADSFLQAVERSVGGAGWWRFPTLAWVTASDTALTLYWSVGALLSLVLLAGWAPAACLGGLWLLYLSLATIGQTFLNFQWDSLLLETGLLAIFLAPSAGRLRWRSDSRYSRCARALLVWLLFRVFFQSGVVKLASGDPSWRELTALAVHFETQPLTAPLGWYAHQFPEVAAKLATLGVLVTELLLPWMLIMPRRLRHGAAAGLLGYLLVIALTGNSGFLGVLVTALCVLQFDFRAWFRTADPASQRNSPVPVREKPLMWKRWVAALGVFVCLLLTVPPMCSVLGWRGLEAGLEPVLEQAAPLRSFNRYGMYAVMTTNRPEIIVEGSEDGVTWRRYDFKYKPGRLDRPPPFVVGHMPRLDWSMWFAALGPYERQPWFGAFLYRLLTAEPAVLALLQADPFGGEAPRRLRARLYVYRFTTPAERTATGDWWRRELRGLYAPVLEHPAELKQGPLAFTGPVGAPGP